MGCQQSVPEKSRKVFAVGGTERMASRAARARVQTSNTAAALSTTTSNSAANSHSMAFHTNGNGNSPATANSSKQSHPKLDSVGHLLPEEVVRRTSSAIKTKEVLLGMPDNPIQVEVCTVDYCESVNVNLLRSYLVATETGQALSSAFVPFNSRFIQSSLSSITTISNLSHLLLSFISDDVSSLVYPCDCYCYCIVSF
jgi:hypothetical protein